MTSLPSELEPRTARCRMLAAEEHWARRCCWFAPVLALAAWGAANRLLLTVLYLSPPRPAFESTWKPAIVVGLLAGALPLAWLAAVLLERRAIRAGASRLPWGVLLCTLWVFVANVGLSVPRIRWTFVEWAKVRTENPSFARNTLFWEARDFERAANPAHSDGGVHCVGSSQMYAAVDLQLLADRLPATFEKNCLAGFGPMQYLWLEDRLLERKPRVVVCWLSEFDFFREDHIPTNRLRWAATTRGLHGLAHAARGKPAFDWQTCWNSIRLWAAWPKTDDLWSERGEFADLAAASVCPLWRLRDQFRRVVPAYWWNVSVPHVVSGSNAGALAAGAVDDEAIENLRENVGRKRFVATNFAGFRAFARDLHEKDVRLLVLEGCSHPEAMRAYDASLRAETREQLSKMSRDESFRYIEAEALPRLDATDFSDAYHLNSVGCLKVTRFLADSLHEHELAHVSRAADDDAATP